MLLAAVTGLVLGALSRGPSVVATTHAIPYRPDPIPATDGAGMPVFVPAPGDRVLLYVSRSCGLCSVELAAWKAGLLAGSDALPRIVTSPRSGDAPYPGLSRALRSRVVHDREGRIARALGVRAVPWAALLDARGRVVAAWAGVLPPEVRQRLLSVLQPPPETRP